ncbi:sugar phosphate isomerase/epimerase family protein [Saliphagus infecundisoli]|uniref:Sugar phosphate isomerase/epimerase family protein n=1 Tax=Saliphagus infecundisoli TaxID=1849069 RepID=A0ABD5Q9Q7_9EURY|nr:sugar phosphate isomerase/epimerase family protein [Saliphagus infecundisoli]
MHTALFTKTFDDRSLEDAIATAAEIGYDGVEIMAREPHFPADVSLERVEGLRELLDDHDMGLPCLATYTGGYARKDDAECDAELETFEAFLERAEILDVNLLRHGAGRPSIREATEEDLERAATWLRRAADLAAEYGKTVGLEIHSHRLTETTEATMDLIERIDRENVGVIHDAGNMFIADDPYGAESLEAIGDRLAHVHVKDLSRIDDPDRADAFALETGRGEEVFRREFLGEGDVDHAPLVEALAERGYDGSVTDESTVRRVDRETVARRELEAMERLIAD